MKKRWECSMNLHPPTIPTNTTYQHTTVHRHLKQACMHGCVCVRAHVRERQSVKPLLSLGRALNSQALTCECSWLGETAPLELQVDYQ